MAAMGSARLEAAASPGFSKWTEETQTLEPSFSAFTRPLFVSGVKHLGHKLARMWDVSVAGSHLDHYATMLLSHLFQSLTMKLNLMQ